MIGVITDVLTKTLGGKGEVAGPLKEILTESEDKGFDSVLVLRNLVRFAGIFDFSGIALLIDKVDETSATNNSADQTAAMIHPLLARVQLMEVSGFGWIFFLWTAVKGIFEGSERPVRLDKLGYATVTWDDKFFSLMLDRRTEYFSDKRFPWAGFFRSEVDIAATLALIVKVSMRSPREVIRIMDVIVREHDIVHADSEKSEMLTAESIEIGLDVYVTDRIGTIYGDRLLAQIFRLNRTSFTNKDVQRVFRVGAQSARTRIQSWESAGIIKLIGTKSAEGGLGRPVNEYSVADARIERVMQRQLITYDTPIVPEADFVETDD
ncbi:MULTISPECIES: hypothetical protein [Mesorhizobium]|uniref:hypothetical protein n=1 Tax=Mesorhizobium TaxID=68287 RepID=UPI0010A972F5|nr:MULTISPECIES: hypothetical protein [Mesorhizobium]